MGSVIVERDVGRSRSFFCENASADISARHQEWRKRSLEQRIHVGHTCTVMGQADQNGEDLRASKYHLRTDCRSLSARLTSYMLRYSASLFTYFAASIGPDLDAARRSSDVRNRLAGDGSVHPARRPMST